MFYHCDLDLLLRVFLHPSACSSRRPVKRLATPTARSAKGALLRRAMADGLSPIPQSGATPSGMSTPAEVVAMAASSVLGAPGEDQMPSKNKPSSESVALGPVSDAAVCNLGRLQAIGGEMEDIGMIPRGRSSANITHDVQVFQVVRGGRLEEMLALLKKHPLVWKTTDSDGCQPLHGDLDVAILDGDPTKRLLLLTVSPLRSGGGGRKTRDGAAARPSWRSGPRPAHIHCPASPRSPSPLPPPLTATRPLPLPSHHLSPHPPAASLLPFPTSPLKTLTSPVPSRR